MSSRGSKAPARTKLHEVIARELRERIVSGELAPGDRLPTEDHLMAEFGIARNTLREALRVLEAQGLVEVRMGRAGGPVITHPDFGPLADSMTTALRLRHGTIGDLDDARRAIETALVARLARHGTDDDFAALDRAIDGAADAAELVDPEAFAAAAVVVHETIFERSHNTTLSVISLLLHEVVLSYYGLTQPDRELRRLAVRSYRKLVRLLRERDADAAAAHWNEQMEYTLRYRHRDVPLAPPAPSSTVAPRATKEAS